MKRRRKSKPSSKTAACATRSSMSRGRCKKLARARCLTQRGTIKKKKGCRGK